MADEHVQYFEVHSTPEADPKLVKLTFENGEFNALVKHPDVSMLGYKLAQFFKDAGGANYVEVMINTPDDEKIGPLILTVQRKFGKTPHELRLEAEQKYADLLNQMEGYK